MSDFKKSSGNIWSDLGDPNAQIKMILFNALRDYHIRLLESDIVSLSDRSNSKDIMRGVFEDACAFLPKEGIQ